MKRLDPWASPVTGRRIRAFIARAFRSAAARLAPPERDPEVMTSLYRLLGESLAAARAEPSAHEPARPSLLGCYICDLVLEMHGMVTTEKLAHVLRLCGHGPFTLGDDGERRCAAHAAVPA